MSDSLTHPLWYRVAELKPRLRAHAAVHCHHYRGEPWYVLQDRASTRYYRLSENTQQVVALLDGRRTLQEIWEALSSRPGEDGPSQGDVVQLLARLHAADLLQSDASPDTAELLTRGNKIRRQAWQQRLMRPLAVRFAFWDPDRFLDRLLPSVRAAFSPLGLLLWSILVVAAAGQGVAHWPALSAHWSARATDPSNLLLLALLYPLVKALHEFGHAFAAKVWGGEVHEMGVMLLVLMPIPYVDASAAHAFREKRRRVVVGAAGIMVELFLSAVALFIWLSVQPGLLRDMAFNVMLIGGVSTVLFNGNPLLRFDGYYVLADLIEIPNLGPRANQYLGYLSKRYLFGLRDAPSPVTARGERAWFVSYGIAAFIYRLIISFAIALLVAGKLFVVGVVLAIWALGVQVLYPLMRLLRYLVFDPALQGKRTRALGLVGGVLAAVIVVVSLLPVASWTRAEGIIRVPERALIRAGTDGFIVRLLRSDGQRVRHGDPLFELEDPLLSARVAVLEWRLRELEARHSAVLVTDPMQAEILKHDLADARAELAEARERFDQLTVHSPAEGTFMVATARDLPGRFVRKGDPLGYVTDLSSVAARVVLPQTAVDMVRRHTEAVEVRFANRPGETIAAQLGSQVPSATDQLPSRVLGSQGGGTIAVDARDAEGLKAMESVFQLDIDLPPRPAGGYLASRVHVRFSHGAEPLARQWYRGLRQLFLARLQL